MWLSKRVQNYNFFLISQAFLKSFLENKFSPLFNANVDFSTLLLAQFV
jgi:hypothetical protein